MSQRRIDPERIKSLQARYEDMSGYLSGSSDSTASLTDLSSEEIKKLNRALDKLTTKDMQGDSGKAQFLQYLERFEYAP